MFSPKLEKLGRVGRVACCDWVSGAGSGAGMGRVDSKLGRVAPQVVRHS